MPLVCCPCVTPLVPGVGAGSQTFHSRLRCLYLSSPASPSKCSKPCVPVTSGCRAGPHEKQFNPYSFRRWLDGSPSCTGWAGTAGWKPVLLRAELTAACLRAATAEPSTAQVALAMNPLRETVSAKPGYASELGGPGSQVLGPVARGPALAPTLQKGRLGTRGRNCWV